ncbi:MAG: hypothetical protein WCY68_04210 [Desulfuromonadales bacterium]
MKSHLALGFFAIYVVVISLCRLLSDRLPQRLISMQKAWGRRLGLLLHFVAQVALPLVVGIIYVGQGVSLFARETERAVFAPVHHTYSLPYLYPRPGAPLPRPAEILANGEIALLLAPLPDSHRPQTAEVYAAVPEYDYLPAP